MHDDGSHYIHSLTRTSNISHRVQTRVTLPNAASVLRTLTCDWLATVVNSCQRNVSACKWNLRYYNTSLLCDKSWPKNKKGKCVSQFYTQILKTFSTFCITTRNLLAKFDAVPVNAERMKHVQECNCSNI